MALKVSPLISSGMVMQRDAAFPVRGEAAPGAEVTVLFDDKTYRTTADAAGAWKLLLDGHPSGGPYVMEISAANEKIALDDIYAGDVWLCSGQSNMEMLMQRLKDDFPEEWQPPVNALIRQFKVPQEWEFSGPRRELSGGRWQAAAVTAGSENLHEFSGVAWFFARALYEKHSVPIGLVTAAWGGTPIEAWMSADALAPFPAKIAQSRRYADPALRAEITRSHETALKAWEDAVDAADRGLAVGGLAVGGLAAPWYSPQTDIAAWDDITLPGNFATSGKAVPADFCGAVWLAKDFDVSASFAASDAQIWLGTITDADTVYVNGTKVGATAYRYPPRKYRADAGLLKEGKNRIVIRVICNNGGGGVTRGKPFRVFTPDETVELAGTWKYRVGAAAPPRPEEFFFQRQPLCLFNAMIAPLLGYPLRGVIWYQGESNDSGPHEYARLFPALINDWRAKSPGGLNDPLPFLFTQLPIFGEPEDNTESGSWAIIREAQAQALSLPATGMAAGLELGEWNDLHPLNKKGIGRRLALAAEKTVYGESNTAPGPMVRAVERRGSRLVITFDNCGAGLTTEKTSRRRERENDLISAFLAPLRRRVRSSEKPYLSVVAGGNVYRLPADIESPDCLSIDISAIENPEKVLYAWANNPRDRGLFNADGLPVIPFRVLTSAACTATEENRAGI